MLDASSFVIAYSLQENRRLEREREWMIGYADTRALHHIIPIKPVREKAMELEKVSE
jgi:hypothetical protein